jgi:hypothetical protein
LIQGAFYGKGTRLLRMPKLRAEVATVYGQVPDVR